jgi:16S rRNA (cytosine1407-C5)-methyltransferase
MGKKKNTPAVDRVGRYHELLSEQEATALEQAVNIAPPSAIRFNPLKGLPVEMADEMSREKGWEMTPVPFCPDGYTLKKSPLPPGRTMESRLGYFYIQDAASMLPVELFEPTGESALLILDLTASPGGKTTHLASRFRDNGLIIANDGTSSRIPALTSTLKTWGAVNSAVTNIPGEKFGLWFPDTFDYVLLDAPCSMENLHPGDRDKREIKSAERGRLAGRQIQLLLSALAACKAGGQVVYSTCTLAPEEDEGVLDAVLRQTGNAVTLTAAGQRIGVDAPGLTAAFGQTYLPETVNALRLWPHRLGTSGFFSAHLRKNASIPTRPAAADQPYAPFNLTPLTARDQQTLVNQLSDGYGFDLNQIMEEFDLSLAGFRESVYAVSRRLTSTFTGLPMQSCGLRLGDRSDNGFELSLEWVTRFGERVTANRLALSQEWLKHWERGEDLPLDLVQDAGKGTILTITAPTGRVMGTGRVTSRGIKNLLPRHLALKS